MIESCYWRAELRADLVWLKRHRTYRRWTEKQQVLFERKLMLVAFQIRSLLERPKVNDQARRLKMPVLKYKKLGGKPFAVMGSGLLHERFDMNRPESEMLPVLDVCNQLIHYYWMQTYSEGQTFFSMLVFSDYKRHKLAYEFRIEDLLNLFKAFGAESSAIVGVQFVWDDRRQDYVAVKSYRSDGWRFN